LPSSHVSPPDEQTSRALLALHQIDTDLERRAFLRDRQNTKETMCHAALIAKLEGLVPIVRAPTVYRGLHGLFLGVPRTTASGSAP
jgi:hypothetical protein